MSLDPRTARVTDTFGSWSLWRQQQGLGPHTGADLQGQQANDFGEAIIATQAGKVEHVGAFASLTSGHAPSIDHGTFGILHAHQEAPISVSLGLSAGDPVTAGQTIGLIGNKGFSTAPHSHCMVSVRKGSTGYWDYGYANGWVVDSQAYLRGQYLTDAALDLMFDGEVALEGVSAVVCKRYVTRGELDQYANRIISVSISMGGVLRPYIPGAPPHVNANFPAVLADGQPVIIKR